MAEPPTCPFCKRPAVHLKRHHLVPKCQGGKDLVDSCLACHRAVHAFFSNKELGARYHTVKALMADDRFRKMVRWISKQDPSRKLTIRRPIDQRKRGKFR